MMDERNTIFCYLLKENFKNDIDSMSDFTGFNRGDLVAWKNGSKQPQKKTIEYILNLIYIPEFSVIKEFFPFDSNSEIRPQLKEMYKGHEERSGLYAFYDSMANLLYIGKASNLFEETYSAIRREHEIVFPAGVKNSQVKRYEVVNYISAYDVKLFDNFDYPKHVESLILRISKPLMNKQIGLLSKAYPNFED